MLWRAEPKELTHFGQRQKLGFYPSEEPPIHVKLNIFFFICLGDFDVFAIRFQLVSNSFAKRVVVHAECMVEDAANVVIQDPPHRIVEVRVNLIENWKRINKQCEAVKHLLYIGRFEWKSLYFCRLLHK